MLETTTTTSNETDRLVMLKIDGRGIEGHERHYPNKYKYTAL